MIGGAIIAVLITSGSREQAERERKGKADYFARNPMTAAQTSANEHFDRCHYIPKSDISEKQKKLMFTLEGCEEDIRDDPRRAEATWPYNPSAPHPWTE